MRTEDFGFVTLAVIFETARPLAVATFVVVSVAASLACGGGEGREGGSCGEEGKGGGCGEERERRRKEVVVKEEIVVVAKRKMT